MDYTLANLAYHQKQFGYRHKYIPSLLFLPCLYFCACPTSFMLQKIWVQEAGHAAIF